MLKSLFDAVMERRAGRLMEHVRPWLPTEGPLLDLGSGTGHLSARLHRELGLEVVAADVSDIHVVGPPPVMIGDAVLPFETGTFSAALLFFMLAYPKDPAAVLAEAARVTHGPIILVQTLHSNRFGYAWFRAREFFWTVVAFHVSKLVGYVSSDAKFTMNARRFFTAQDLQRELAVAGLRIRARRERSLLPGRALVVAGWILDSASARCAEPRATADSQPPLRVQRDELRLTGQPPLGEQSHELRLTSQPPLGVQSHELRLTSACLRSVFPS